MRGVGKLALLHLKIVAERALVGDLRGKLIGCNSRGYTRRGKKYTSACKNRDNNRYGEYNAHHAKNALGHTGMIDAIAASGHDIDIGIALPAQIGRGRTMDIGRLGGAV